MPVRVQGSLSVRAPREAVWSLLFDPQVLMKLVPGCQRLEWVADDRFEATAVIGVGAIKGTFSGAVAIADQRPPEHYRLTITARGTHGYINGEATIDLTEQGESTLLTYEGQGQVGGPLATVGQRLLDVTATTLLDQSFTSLRAEVEARHTASAKEGKPATRSGPSLMWFRMMMAVASLSPAQWRLASLAGYGGLLTNFLAVLAYAIVSSMHPGVLIPAVTGTVLLVTAVTWPATRLLRRSGTRLTQGVSRGISLLGESLLPLSVYLVAYEFLPRAAGSVVRSATVAAGGALLYGAFRWTRDESLSSPYLVDLSVGTLLFLSSFTLSLPPVAAALCTAAAGLLLGTYSGSTSLGWGESRRTTVRQRHGVLAAATLIVGAIITSTVSLPLTPALLLFFWLAAAVLFILARFLQHLSLGALLALMSYGAVTLSFFESLTYLNAPREAFWILTALWVGALTALWYALREEVLPPFGPTAYLTSVLLGLGLIGWLSPLSFGVGWTTVDTILAGPLHSSALAPWPIPTPPAPPVALLLLALLWGGGALLRRLHPSFSFTVSGLMVNVGLGMITTYLPPLLVTISVALLVGGATLTLAGSVLACLGLGIAFLLFGPRVQGWYPPETLLIGGWAALAFTVALSLYNAPIAAGTLAGIALFCFTRADRTRSFPLALLGLSTLTAAARIAAFDIPPLPADLTLSLFYPALLGLSHWLYQREQKAASLLAWLEAVALALYLGVREFSGGLPGILIFAILTVAFLTARPTQEGWPGASTSLLRPGNLLTHVLTALLHQTLRISFLTPHLFAALATAELPRVLSLPPATQAVAFALLAWSYLGLEIVQGQRGVSSRTRPSLLVQSSHTFALLALILATASPLSGSPSVGAYLLVGGLAFIRYRRALPGTGELFAHIAVVCVLGAAGLLEAYLGVQVRELYTSLLALYLTFALLRQPALPLAVDTGGGPGLPVVSLDQARQQLPGTLISAGLLATGTGYPAGALISTGGTIHLIFLGIGALCLLHLFQARRQPAWTTFTTLAVFLAGILYYMGTADLNPGVILFLLAIGSAIALDALYAGGEATLPRAASPTET